MGKKVKEFKSGDFIFAKVKGYPAWPARVQRLNGKKYFVYFYGTGETANLPPNMIFDYAENKDKFLTKTVKRRDFNDGVKQIEYDFANNVPLEHVIGVPMEDGAEAPANDTANDSAIDATMDDSMADTTANETAANDTASDDANATQNDATVEDSDDAGALVIDEEKAPKETKGKKSKADAAKTPAKDTPKPKEPKTPRGKGKKEETKKDDAKDKDRKEEKTADEELVSRSGRKIRPKKYMDEQSEENATLPSPAPKRRRGASPEKTDGAKEKELPRSEKALTQFNAVKQSELEGLKAPFKPVDEEKDNILIAYLPNGSYIGIKLFQSRPTAFKNEASRLQWDKQAASNAITLKMQLERDQITPESVQGQLVMDLNLTDEEKATLDKERETEEKKSRVNFLKTEMKLIELDAKIKSCLCLEKADTELCLKLLDDLLELEVKPLMLLKHPTCLETVKRMRAYVGNTPSWDLSESAALVFSKQAHRIRKKADTLYKNMKEHFQTPDGLSFWEYFSERVLVFKKYSSNLHPSELLELVHEPLELTQPYAHTMRAAIDEANHSVPPLPEAAEDEEEQKQSKKKGPGGKGKKSPAISTPSKSKRQSSRNKNEEEKEKSTQNEPEDQPAEPPKPIEAAPEETPEETEKAVEGDKADENKDADKNVEEVAGEKIVEEETPKEAESAPVETNEDVEMAEPQKAPEEQNSTDIPEKVTEETPTESETSKEPEKAAKESKSTEKTKDTDKPKEEKGSKKDKKTKEDKSESDKSKAEESEKSGKDSVKSDKTPKSAKDNDKHTKDGERSERKDKRSAKDRDASTKDSTKNGKESEKSGKDKDDKSEAKDEKEKQESGEPRAKRSRESKKTEPPPRSPAKRKTKF